MSGGVPVYVAGKHNDRWHIAAHRPAGYGVRALCGVSWNQGWFRELRVANLDENDDFLLCRRCERLALRPA